MPRLHASITAVALLLPYRFFSFIKKTKKNLRKTPLHPRSLTLTCGLLALLFTLSGCFQKPALPALDSLCEPATLFLAPVIPGKAASTEQELQKDHISLFIWNSYKGKVDGWLNDLSTLGRNNDLVLLQEAYLKNDLVDFLDESGWNWNIATTFRYRAIPTGVLTASKIAADKHCHLTTMEPWIRLPKGILISRYKLTNTEKQLVVANVHLINFTFNTGVYSTQLATLKSILEQHDGPLIVAGDFNTWSSDRSQLVNTFTTELRLSPVEFNNNVRTEIFGRKIDHVYSRELTVLSAKSVAVSTSDHNPMIVEFALLDASRRAAGASGQNTVNVVSSP
ncbi:MAG: endonuclease/exonuclease/phosphatase family protein [Desulforhopalus sp.]